ncbi:MAG: lactoylglutathione lyase [Corynebacterium marinum]|jgi:predicted lactoylglutathione lyase|uniref:Lactoylglutathione lyase n=1 Tax=Corynebacterium marinum TaxID=349751 RepID=A0A847H9I0_9CORY|nr:lactoylglutathione lyase [Corynebacterium marinum]
MTQRLNHPQIYINLPVSDLAAAKAFYTALGWDIIPEYTDDNASAVQASDAVVVMLLKREFFATFHRKETAAADSPREMLNALAVDTRADVDEMIRRGREAGANVYNEPKEGQEMYYGSFEDLDGHGWEFVANG